ncbi:hypothetical protein GO730_03985 [Spirosoma sp. HMF3257]|uniref:YtxH domain-containing protein n=1 Tax=Spirosoma telluris TaxID=2183553 RepID=A0A327NEQ9_9BACT|nr:hypothetical protein [Spirosoma telluris]RAI73761.1 hypothetical protein HMF3257_03925 [Spirosoma telluris]
MAIGLYSVYSYFFGFCFLAGMILQQTEMNSTVTYSHVMKKYGKSTLLTMVTGVATGITIGYLTAPQSGRKTRQKLANTLEEQTHGFTTGIKDEWNKTIAMAEEVVTNLKAEAGIFAQKAKQTVEKTKDEAKSALQETDFKKTYTDKNDKVDEVADVAKHV